MPVRAIFYNDYDKNSFLGYQIINEKAWMAIFFIISGFPQENISFGKKNQVCNGTFCGITELKKLGG